MFYIERSGFAKAKVAGSTDIGRALRVAVSACCQIYIK